MSMKPEGPFPLPGTEHCFPGESLCLLSSLSLAGHGLVKEGAILYLSNQIFQISPADEYIYIYFSHFNWLTMIPDSWWLGQWIYDLPACCQKPTIWEGHTTPRILQNEKEHFQESMDYCWISTSHHMSPRSSPDGSRKVWIKGEPIIPWYGDAGSTGKPPMQRLTWGHEYHQSTPTKGNQATSTT